MVITKKICLIGDFAVGKTSLIRRYVEGQFSDKYLSTVGVKISRKSLETARPGSSSPIQFKLIIWDLEGRTKFEALAPSYLKGASGAVVVGALDREETLDSMVQHIQLFSSTNPNQPIAIAFNKADLVPGDRRQQLLEQYRPSPSPRIVGHHVTSAKTGENVDDLFRALAQSWPIASR